ICYLLQYCSFVFLMNRNCRSSFHLIMRIIGV
ncbi:hypothetical protein A5816_000084, partial [Enterococcus sp. 3G1_DIV0629]